MRERRRTGTHRGLLLGLLLVAACSPPPVSTRSPTPAAAARTAAPTVALTPVPAGGSAGPATKPPSFIDTVTIPMADRTMEVTLAGDPTVLTSWRGATEDELRPVDFGASDIGTARLSDHDLVLAWVGTICDDAATLEVGATSLRVVPEPRQPCDAMAVTRGVVLTYADEVPLAISVEQAPTTLQP